jgi:hypothetical protein
MSEQRWSEELGRVSISAEEGDVYAGQPRSSPVSTVSLEPVVRTRVRTVRLQDRDRKIVTFVARFRQVTTDQVRQVFFPHHRSPTQPKVVLKRLVNQKLLKRVDSPRRSIGGEVGGSAQYVYYLDRGGWNLAGKPTKNPPKYSGIHYDWLAVVDIYIDVKQNMNLLSYRTEARGECHFRINHILLEPDLYLEVDRSKDKLEVFVESDMGTETPTQIEDKMARYHHAWLGAPARWEPFPYVLWVVPDIERRTELQSLIAKQPADSRPMHLVALYEDVVQTLNDA